MLTHLRISVLMLLVFSVLTGIVYPLAITGVAQVVFPKKANGSLIPRDDGKLAGSELIGQPFDDPKYFWGRPSATNPMPYNAGSSTGSNWAVGNPAQRDALRQRTAQLRATDPENKLPIPLDLITASGSGLDPHISPAAARYQASRVARVRGLKEADVLKLIDEHTQARQLGILGDPAVNVLQLNLALDQTADTRAKSLAKQ